MLIAFVSWHIEHLQRPMHFWSRLRIDDSEPLVHRASQVAFLAFGFHKPMK